VNKESSRPAPPTGIALGFPSLRSSIPVLLVLMLAAIIAYLDRQIINLLLDPIRRDLGISDTQVSLLQGAAFGVFFAAFGLPIGFLVDRTNRKALIAAGMLLWSIATACCGLSNTFWELFAARAGVAIGEAVLYPSTYSLIADLFQPTHRGRAFMAFNTAGAYGIAISFLAGGLVLQTVSHVRIPAMAVLGAHEPWQMAFIACALPGLVLSLLILAIPKVNRREVGVLLTSDTPASMIGFARANPRLAWMLCAMYAAAAVGINGLLAWMAAFYIRNMGVTPSQAGYLMGGLFIIGGAIGGPLLGVAADAMLRRGILDGKMRMLSVCATLAAIGNLFWWTQTSLVASLAIGLFVFVNQMGITTMAGAAVNELVPNELRGRMSAVYLFLTSIVGASVGPTAVALITEHGFNDPNRVGSSIAALVIPCLLIAAALAWLVRGQYGEVVRHGRGT
jgi:MFS family permease